MGESSEAFLFDQAKSSDRTAESLITLASCFLWRKSLQPDLHIDSYNWNNHRILSAKDWIWKELTPKIGREAGTKGEFLPGHSSWSEFFSLSFTVRSAGFCELVFLGNEVCSQCKHPSH